MKRFIIIFALLTLVPALAFGINSNPKRPMATNPVLDGSEVVSAPVTPTLPEAPAIDETDLIGDTTTIGMSWYDNQHNGTCGRMNTLESTGWRQFAWMKGENSGATIRHIWWNGIDPNNAQVYPGQGVAVESSTKGGFCNMDVGSNGGGFPTYHYQTSSTPGGLPWTAASIDLIPHQGAFLDYRTPITGPSGITPPFPTQVIWPRIAITNQSQRIQVVATNQVGTAGFPQRQWYVSGTYNPGTFVITWDPNWQVIDWTQTIAVDVATSPVTGSNKTLFAWTKSRQYGAVPPNVDSAYNQHDNDIYYLIDSDGLNPNFSQKINLTNFINPDPSLLPDTLRADKDTLRAYTDLNCFIDNSNNAHIAFTTKSYFFYEGTYYWNASLLWHWSEANPNDFRVIGSEEYFAFNNNINCGVWNFKAQRPSLGQAANGNLYCMYQVYDTDTTHLSSLGFPSGEIYVSYSTDNGQHWTVGTNVTSTITPNGAGPGACNSELTPTMAKKVDTYCHIEYVLDKDAGNVNQTEGTWTNNPVRYHRVPVSQLNSAILTQTKFLHVTTTTPPAIDVTLTPVNPPIVIPANGGSFQFNASVRRTLGPAAPFIVWSRDRNPNGTYTGNLLGPVQINPPVNVNVTRLRVQNVPNTWPAGIHTYLGYANTTVSYPAIDSSFFTWTKLADDNGGPWMNDATCGGELFPGEVSAQSPVAFALAGASPNPFNPTTTISFTLPEASQVSLKVFDVNGREVATLIDGQRAAGAQQATFDGAKLSSGVYFYTLTAGSHVATGKMALVK